MTLDYALDHLWQSTLVAAGLALLALAFRRTHARTRYWIWFAASIKFLIPFAALASLGAQLEWREALLQAPPEWTLVAEALSQPFSAPSVDVVAARAIRASGSVPLTTVAATIWALGCMVDSHGLAASLATRVVRRPRRGTNRLGANTRCLPRPRALDRAPAHLVRHLLRAWRVRRPAPGAALAARHRHAAR